jgi:type I restriction enzyme, R subunit
MNKKDFNEDTRVKIPATLQFLRIGYNYQSLKESNIDFNTKIFINRFKPALEKINNISLSDSEIQSLLAEIHTLIKNNDLGREFYKRLTSTTETIKLVDWENYANNDFAVVDELPFAIEKDKEDGSFRPDINILINGMPLAFLEVKQPNNEGSIQAEFNRMLNERLKTDAYKKFFNLLQVITFSNNMEYENCDDDVAELIKAGSFYSTPNSSNTSFSFFREDTNGYHENYKYRALSDEYSKEIIEDLGHESSVFDTSEFKTNNEVNTPCNKFITSMFDKERFIYLLRYGILYVNDKVPEKHVMRYPQFFATRAITKCLDSGQKSGIIWHTQGSGKTELAAYSHKILTDYYSKKNVIARFFFVVDRLDLLTQDNSEFSARFFKVTNCKSRDEFSKELDVVLSRLPKNANEGEFVVVNIQKFENEIPEARNEYNANIQRVFFVDEAHRSYSLKGEYLKNLMMCDPNAVFIALTGTPLLTKTERTNLKFGDYIHKYFYDKSIADGYTLRIKKEKVDTVVRKNIKRDLQIESDSIDFSDAAVYESDAYIKDLGNYINKDFQNFRLINGDNSLGGMIVCKSNPQAKKIYEWFKANSSLSVGLVISNESDPKQEEMNKHNQTDFKYNGHPDLLIVHFMLTTGYDVHRLKKMYLLRGPKAQSLLQTISRVNRPYKAPNGKIYKYGYITDFVDIEEEYDRTISDYLKELEEEIKDPDENNNNVNITGLVIDSETIKTNYTNAEKALNDIICVSNNEEFNIKLGAFNKDTLFKIRRYLNIMKSCYTEFCLSNIEEAKKMKDKNEDVKRKLKLVQLRIDWINLSEKPTGTMDILSNKDIIEITYNFLRNHISVLDLSKFAQTEEYEEFKEALTKVQKEIKNNKNKKDLRLLSLDEILKKIFGSMNIRDVSDLSNLTEEMKKALAEVEAINKENERIAAIYDGHYSMVKTYQDVLLKRPELNNKDVEDALILIYGQIKNVIGLETLAIQGREGFINETKKKVTPLLFKAGLYKKLQLKDWLSILLSDIYTNLQIYK